MSRVDKILPKDKQPEYYSDFSMNMDKNAVTGQLLRLVNADAVKQSIVNLVLTGQKERPYQPWLGSRVRESLFDNIDDELAVENIRTSIANCLKENESRAKVLKINIQSDLEGHGYNVQVHFSIINLTTPQMAEIFIERVR